MFWERRIKMQVNLDFVMSSLLKMKIKHMLSKATNGLNDGGGIKK